MKEKLIKFLKKNIKTDIKIDIDKLLEKPKIATQGDFSLPMFTLSRELKKSPQEIAKEFEEKLSNPSIMPEFLSKIVAVGPFLNFYLNNKQITRNVLTSIINGKIFNIKASKIQKVLIEYPSPNTNKALHVGHVRNLLLGNSMSKIFEKVGHKVTKINLYNDRGIAICKAMLAYKLEGENKTPYSEDIWSDKFVGNYYELFEKINKEKPELKLEDKANDMLKKWEEGDKETIKLWEKIRNWVFQGNYQTYVRFKYNSHKEYFESNIYDKGKDIVDKALKEDIKGFKIDDENGAVYVDLEDKGYGKKYLLRGNGTTLYMTQDLYLAHVKQKEFKCDKYIFIVGNEQQYHFEVLFEILDRVGFGGLDKNHHFAFGMLYNKEGKKFSSRTGDVIDARGLLDLVEGKALDNLKKRNSELTKKDLDLKKRVIGYSALAFGILKINAMDNYNFDVDKALSMTGETGPYVQYTYARIQSVLRKAEFEQTLKIDYSLFAENEIQLVKTLQDYPNVVLEAASKYKPSAISHYLVKVCQQFNEFYQNCHILKDKNDIKIARLLLCQATGKVLCDGLQLLDIDVLDEM